MLSSFIINEKHKKSYQITGTSLRIIVRKAIYAKMKCEKENNCFAKKKKKKPLYVFFEI